jgi:hypothetical protein
VVEDARVEKKRCEMGKRRSANEQGEGGEDLDERVGFGLGKGESFGKRAREGRAMVLTNDMSYPCFVTARFSLPE